jgi:ribonuclease R
MSRNDKRGKRPEKKFQKESEKDSPKRSGEAPRESRGAFVFTDRSGKQHAFASRNPAPAAEEERPLPRGPGGPSADRRPSPHRGPGGPKKFDRGTDHGADRSTERGPRPERGGPRGPRPDRAPDRGTRPGNRPGSIRGPGAGPAADRVPKPAFRERDEWSAAPRGPRRGKGKDKGKRRFEEKGEPRGGVPSRDKHRKGDRHAKSERKGPSANTAGSFKLKARIDKNRKGFGFLQFENKEYEDAFLNPHEAERFFHGDRVEATVSERGEVVDVTVIEHRFRELVGRFYPMGKTGMVVYERKKAREELPVIGETKNAKVREWVRAKVIYPEDDFGKVTCEILETYGEELPARADIQMVAAEYSLVEEHSPEAVAEAESFVLDLKDPHRTDLSHVPFITIDGETARDFDDAIYVERNREGGFTLWVAIADVSHYVRKDTALDDEAYSRGTSVYFPERAFHMLPRALSENLCSLRPDGPRLTMTSKITYDRNGKKLGVEVMNSLIHSRRRATYNEIQAEADANVGNEKWEFRTHYDLYAILRRLRNERGSIDFDLPEPELRCEPTGEPISIKLRPRLDAHRLIEEFMIAANESVTEWALARKWPFVYRVHDEPVKAAISRFAELCANYGVNFVYSTKNLPEAMNAVVKEIEGHPAQTLLNMALLRSMAQAHYSSVYGEHFGLASKAYTHFTSPIRRYPDLVVHRMLKLVLTMEREKMTFDDKEREEIEEKLAEITEHCSYRERIASDAERESIKLKQARIMLKEVGNEFDAKIGGMNEHGMFAAITEPYVEGFIAQEGMNDDFYSYNEDRQMFVGKRTKKNYKVGDALRVRVDRVDLDLRRIDLSVISADGKSTESVTS